MLSFIEELTQGFKTKPGPTGTGLSQGQKQRILIARAIYRNPQYLLFDEATNTLDANKELAIVENLKAFFKDRTVVIVAHRLITEGGPWHRHYIADHKEQKELMYYKPGFIVEWSSSFFCCPNDPGYYRLVYSLSRDHKDSSEINSCQRAEGHLCKADERIIELFHKGGDSLHSVQVTGYLESNARYEEVMALLDFLDHSEVLSTKTGALELSDSRKIY